MYAVSYTHLDVYKRQVMDGKKELKAWAAIAEYMQSFEDTDKDGIANVPEYYNTTPVSYTHLFVYSTQKAKCLQVLLQIFPLQHRMYRLS